MLVSCLRALLHFSHSASFGLTDRARLTVDESVPHTWKIDQTFCTANLEDQTSDQNFCAARLGNRLAVFSFCEDNRSMHSELGYDSRRPPGPWLHARKLRRIEVARVMPLSPRRLPEGQGHDLALTVLYVPCSLDSCLRRFYGGKMKHLSFSLSFSPSLPPSLSLPLSLPLSLHLCLSRFQVLRREVGAPSDTARGAVDSDPGAGQRR